MVFGNKEKPHPFGGMGLSCYGAYLPLIHVKRKLEIHVVHHACERQFTTIGILRELH